jgi:hypothetical protein
MSNFTNLALDMGTSGWKIGYKNSQFYLDALVSTGPLREQVNGIFDQDYSRDSLDNIAINTDQGLFYVGKIAKFSQAPAYSGYGQERYLQTDFMDPMTLAAMSECRLGTGPTVITTAIPAKWEDATAYQAGKEVPLVQAISDHFSRDFTIDREGQRGQKTISIDEVKVLTETQALLFSFLLDKNGQVAIENFADMRFAVVDIGELTTCIDIFRGLAREGESITLTDISMGKVHKATAAQVLERTGRDLSHWEIRDIIWNGGQIMVPAKGNRAAQSFNITPIYNDNVAALKPVLRSAFGDYITRSGDIHYIIVGGGGSETIGQILVDTYRQAKAVGQFATLQGLRNYGERLCAIKNRS